MQNTTLNLPTPKKGSLTWYVLLFRLYLLAFTRVAYYRLSDFAYRRLLPKRFKDELLEIQSIK